MGDLIEIPVGLGKRIEPCIRGKGVPVWILQAYHEKRGMTAEQIAKLWTGFLTVDEVQAALDYEPQRSHLFD